jgi:hypothetical protein
MPEGIRQAYRPTSVSHYTKIKTLLGSRTFLGVVLALFFLQAGWIAIRSSYPLAFDEGYHVGIIQLYAHQWSPFFSHLSDQAAQFGPLATDPSYLYHYLMSFPYRVIGLFTHSTFAVVLSLRFINIGLFAVGVLLFRKVLNYSGASKALINLVMLAFVLLPLETFTAAQINYDNLLFPITAGALLLSLKFAEKLKAGSFDVKILLLLAATCFTGAQVKFSFLPIFAAIGLFIAWQIWKQAIVTKKYANFNLRQQLRALRTRTNLVLVGLVLLSGGLFAWRYGYNLVQYHSPMPDCAKVVSVQSCEAWGTWARNHQLAQHHVAAASPAQAFVFLRAWTHIMGDQLFTVLNAANGGAMENPVRQLVFGASVVVLIGLGMVIQQSRKLVKIGFPLALFLLVGGTYLLALGITNYTDFTRYGIPIAVQGRYLLPILLLGMVILARAYSLSLQKAPQWKVLMVGAALVVGIQGGGMITYMLRTNQSWYWTAAAQARIEPGVVSEANQTGLLNH